MRKALLTVFTFILFTNLVFAQIPGMIRDGIPTRIVSKQISQYFGVIFILGFILLLLIIGGVISLPTGIGRWGAIIIILILIFAIPYILLTYFSEYFPSYAEVPENFKIAKLPDPIGKAFTLLGLPEEWSYVPAIIYLFIIPFVGIYTVVWSFLVATKIFDEPRVRRLLAFLITFLTIPVGWFIKLVWLLFAAMGAWSIAVFAMMFIVGVFFRGAGFVGKEYTAFQKLVNVRRARLKDAIKEIKALETADLETIRTTTPRITMKYSDILSFSSVALLEEAIKQEDVGKARAFIRKAVGELKKLI